MKVILVDNLLLKREGDSQQFELQPHLGLISLIATLRNNGHDAELYDPKLDIVRGDLPVDSELYKKIASKILSFAPDVVGFTSLGCNFICTVKIARYIKQKQPTLPILLGGPHSTVLHREIIDAFSEFDVIVRNEADLKINGIIEALPSGAFDSIEGVTFRRQGEIVSTIGSTIIDELDKLPFPAYSAYPIKEFDITSIRVEAGRGCPFSCTFCSTASFFGRSYRLKTPERLCAEMDFLNKNYGIKKFGLTHDLFTVNKIKVAEFCKAVAGRNYEWRCSARMDCVDKDLLTLMKSAGCQSIYYGIETGSIRMQKISKKKLNLEIFDHTLSTTLKLNIAPTLSFIVGYPEETLEDIKDTLDLIGNCLLKYGGENPNLQLHLLAPEPGTALVKEHFKSLKYDGFISDFNFPTLEADDSDIIEKNPVIFTNHHYYDTIVPRQFYVITTSLFDALHILGPVVTRYILEHSGGSLWLLNEDVYKWTQLNSVKAIGLEELFKYLTQRFSKESVLVSLVRYKIEAFHLLNQRTPVLQTKRGKKGNRKQAGKEKPAFRLLPQIHNAPQIIHLLKRSKQIPIRLLNSRIDLLIHLHAPTPGNRIVESYIVNDEALLLLEPIKDAIAPVSIGDC